MLAEKTGKLLPSDPAARYQAIQWLMWQMGGVGPMFGQLGFFHKFAGKDFEDKRPRDRYVAEAGRLLGVLEQRLQGRDWIMGDQYTIADIAILPWVRNLVEHYDAGELVDYPRFTEVQRVLSAWQQRPAVQRGLDFDLGHPVGALFAGTLWLGNAAYMHLSVSFIQMLKALMPAAVYGVGCALGCIARLSRSPSSQPNAASIKCTNSIQKCHTYTPCARIRPR